MTRADAVQAAQDQIVALTLAADAVKHTSTDRPQQVAYRSHIATIDLAVAFPHAKNPMDMEHIQAALTLLADVAPPNAQVNWSGLSLYANWTEELSQ